MIHLMTGLPGAGKTLRQIWYIDQAVKSGRAVYAVGIEGLTYPGVEVLEHPNDWESLPDGSFIVVDEAQKYWRSRRAGEPHEAVRALSEHRHRGFDFLLVTQHPTMLDKYVRTLVGKHEHLVRKFGIEAAQVFEWSEIHDDVQSPTARDNALESLWPYPKPLYQFYRSATLHTVKRKVPIKVWLFLGAAILAPILFWLAFSRIGNVASRTTTDDAPAASAPAAAAGTSGWFARDSSPASRMTPQEWAARFQPRIPAIPWSAPAYDGFDVQQYPRMFCVINGDARRPDSRCRCYTQQATRLEIDHDVCRIAALHGIFDPLLPPQDQARGRGNEWRPPSDVSVGQGTGSARAGGPNLEPIRREYQPPAFDRLTGRPTSF